MLSYKKSPKDQYIIISNPSNIMITTNSQTSSSNLYKFCIPKKKMKSILILLMVLLIFTNIFILYKIKITKIMLQENTNLQYLLIKSKSKILYENSEVLKVKTIQKDIINNPKNLTEVHIALALNNNFIYQTLVSISSALANNNKETTFLVYHIMITSDFKNKNKEKINKFKEKYKNNLAINFYDMSDTFKGQEKWHGTVAAYFRILLPELLPDLNRIIYFDGDTLVLKDLKHMFTLPFYNHYILGKPTTFENKLLKFGIETHLYLNSGVLLFNLQKIREDNKTAQILEFLSINKKNLYFPDQDAMNYIFYPNIGLLPYQYGIMCYHNDDNLFNIFAYNIKYIPDKQKLSEGNKNPGVIHLVNCHPKVWSKNTKFYVESYKSNICQKYHNYFYYYANLTNYYDEIYKNLITMDSG